MNPARDNPCEEIEKSVPAELLFGLDDRPRFWIALMAALQHLLAIFVPIITPPLLICGALNTDMATTTVVVGMSLFISGAATWIQIRKLGPMGSGLLSIQGTSFTFVNALITIGQAGGLPLIFGVCLAGSAVEMVISRFIPLVRRLIPPLVSGIVVTLIGLSLIGAGVFNCAGGGAAMADGSFGSVRHLALAGLVLAVILALNRSRNDFVRMGSIVAGLLTGYAVAAVTGGVDFSPIARLDRVILPIPFRYGLAFRWSAFVPVALLYVVTAIETVGDITATSIVSRQSITGPLYGRRLAGGMLGDGFNSLLASVFNTFPNSTFSQNNGIIQLTGIASRSVGYLIAALLMLLGLSPLVSGVFALMPAPVLGGGTLLMFGTVAAAGIRIIATQPLDRRALLIVAASLGTGMGVVMAPDVLKALPEWAQQIFGSGVVTGGLTAVLCNVLLPDHAGHRDPA